MLSSLQRSKTPYLKIIAFVLILSICTLMLVWSKEIFSGISLGIQICLQTLIPSMFGFMILSDIIANSKLSQILSRPFRLFSRLVFKLDGELFSIFLLSLLGGYPIGAKIIAEKIRNGTLSTESGQRMLDYCIHCSPAFLISGVSAILWNQLSLGVMLCIAQTLSGILMGFLLSRRKPVIFSRTQQKQTYSPAPVLFVNSVNRSARSMGIVCSFVVLFCGIFSLTDLLPLSQQNLNLIKGLLEVTSGCQMIQTESAMASILLVSLYTSFGGVCVWLQIMALLNGTGVRMFPFICKRLLYTLFSVGLSWLGIQILQPTVDCMVQNQQPFVRIYSVSPLSAILLLLLGMMLLLFFGTSAKIELKCKNCVCRKVKMNK